MKSCAVIPAVRNKKTGNVEYSKLFKDLLYYTNNRDKTVDIYKAVKNDSFIQDNISKLVLDEYGEPTLRSLIKNTDISTFSNDKRELDMLNRKLGANKPMKYSIENWESLVNKAVGFNDNKEYNEDYIASVVKTKDAEGNPIVQIKVEPRTKENAELAKEMKYNQTLNGKLKRILLDNNISVGSLTELERRSGINGVTDFSQAKHAAKGIAELIRLREGVEGEKALPEEFAHWALEALGNNPIVNRMIDFISKSGLAEAIIGDEYSEYYSQYNGDSSKLAKEAAGKLLAMHLLEGASANGKPYSSILLRVTREVGGMLDRLDAADFETAIIEADNEISEFTKQILKGSLNKEFDNRNIDIEYKLFNIEAKLKRDKQIFDTIYQNELKRLQLYQERGGALVDLENYRKYLSDLQGMMQRGEDLKGISTFLEKAVSGLRDANKKLNDIMKSNASLNAQAAQLRTIRDFCFSYSNIADLIREQLIEEEHSTHNRYGISIRNLLNEVSILVDDTFVNYKKQAMPLFCNFLIPYVGPYIEVKMGKFKGQQIYLSELIQGAANLNDDNPRKELIMAFNKDISFFDRWLDAAADSSDFMIKIIDKTVKDSKENARLKTIEDMKKLEAAGMKLEQAGIIGQEWMFEVDKDGHKTGNYIQKINYGQYEKDKRDFEEKLISEYGENPVGENADTVVSLRKEWFKKHRRYVKGDNGKLISEPNPEIYENKDFAKQMENKDKKEFYDTVMKMKKSLEEYLPNTNSIYRTIKIRKDLLERVKSSKDITSGAAQIFDAVRDSWLRRSDDTDFGSAVVMQDFEGNDVNRLAVFYTHLKEGESEDDVSTDVVSTMISYAAMANDYHEMNKVIECLELGRTILKERELVSTKGGKTLKERINILGSKSEKPSTKKAGKGSNFQSRLDDYFSMQVYNRYMNDEGGFLGTNIDVAKGANNLNHMTSIHSLGLNVLSGISNVLTGNVMMRIESIAGEYYTESNTLRADGYYAKELPKFLAEIGNRVKTSKLALFDEKFNVMQEYEQQITDMDFDRRTWYSKMFGTSALFVLNNAGEHWMQNRTALALADQYRMKDAKGKIISLWDALEVRYIQKDGSLGTKDAGLGAKLIIKDGVSKENGTPFTEEDIKAFTLKAKKINQRMHGIYNKIDRSAVQKLAVGRMAIMFRKWIVPSLNRRFAKETMDFDIDDWTEGYYRTGYKVLTRFWKEYRAGQFRLTAFKDSLSKKEKQNLKRAATEMCTLAIITLALSLIKFPEGKDKNWWTSMAEYQLKRLHSEVGSMTPGLQIAEEFFKIVNSPAASIDTLEKITDLAGLFNPNNYEWFAGEDAIIKSGRFKGDSRGERIFFRSPLVPMGNTLYKATHPEEAISYFN